MAEGIPAFPKPFYLGYTFLKISCFFFFCIEENQGCFENASETDEAEISSGGKGESQNYLNGEYPKFIVNCL